MADPTPVLFPIEPEAADPVRIELTEELAQTAAALLTQVLSAQQDEEEDGDDD